MFAADLSWTDNHDEKVHEHKARKAKNRDGSIKSASTEASNGRSKTFQRKDSSTTSIEERISTPSTPRRPFWSRPAFKSNTDSVRRERKPAINLISPTQLQEEPRKPPLPLPELQLPAGWNISKNVKSSLPSGGLIEPTQSQGVLSRALHSHSSSSSSFPEPSFSPQRSNSLAGQVTVETSLQRIDEFVKPANYGALPRKSSLQNLSNSSSNQGNLQSQDDSVSTLTVDTNSTPPPVPPKDDSPIEREKHLPTINDLSGSYQGADMGTTTTIWSDAKPKVSRRPSGLRHRRSNSSEIGTPRKERSNFSHALDALTVRKESFEDHALGPVKETHEGSSSASSSSYEDRFGIRSQSPQLLTHFQRFIRRMEAAGPRVVYDHLKEEWQIPEDETSSAELALEKRLWVLTALHLNIMSEKFLVSGEAQCHAKMRGICNVMELDGNIAEVLQLSALCPDASVHYLSTTPIPKVQLPNQISCSCIPVSDLPRIPYPSSSLDLIRATTIPSLLPSSHVPSLLTECYRVLAPGGSLELRLIDPLPERKNSGPMLRAWIEVRLLLNLEMSFRCTRPSLLVPQWVQAAGFQLPIPSSTSRFPSQTSDGESNSRRQRTMSEAVSTARCLHLPAAVDNQGVNGAYVDEEVGAMVARELWKDVWGDYVTDRKGQEKWWWENEGCLKEAMERGTKWNVMTLVATKTQ